MLKQVTCSFVKLNSELIHRQVSVPRYWLNTYGRRAFSVAVATVWNSLPEDMRDCEYSVDSYRLTVTEDTFIFAVLVCSAV